jgi:deoxyribonuclease V
MASDPTASPWPVDASRLAALQVEIAGATPSPYAPGSVDGLRLAGCFICFPRGAEGIGGEGDPAWAAAASCTGGTVHAIARVTGRAAGPYRPGLLALREGPLLFEAVTRLPERPDLLVVNATGRDHPRRCGLAMHLGWAMGIPSIGVTHRPLYGEGPWPDTRRGAWSPIRLEGEEVARWLRTRDRARPLAIHPGWRTDLSTATSAVLAMTPARGGRTPLPLRAARQAAREARALGEGRASGPAGPLGP